LYVAKVNCGWVGSGGVNVGVLRERRVSAMFVSHTEINVELTPLPHPAAVDLRSGHAPGHEDNSPRTNYAWKLRPARS
jgi:hypothetical protein